MAKREAAAVSQPTTPTGNVTFLREMSGGAKVFRDEAGQQWIQLPNGQWELDARMTVQTAPPEPPVAVDPAWGLEGLFSPGWESRLWEPGRSYGTAAPPIFRASDIVFHPDQEDVRIGSEGMVDTRTIPGYWGLRSAPNIQNREYFLLDLFAPGDTPRPLSGMIRPVTGGVMYTESGLPILDPVGDAQAAQAAAEWDALSKAIQERGPAGFTFGLKTGGRHGQVFGYAPVTGPDGQTYYVPIRDFGVQGGKNSVFDTNAGNRATNRALATMALMAAGAGLWSAYGGAGAGEAAGAAGAAEAGGAAATGDFFGGLTAAEAGAFGTNAGNVAGLFGQGAAGAAAGAGGTAAGGAAAGGSLEGAIAAAGADTAGLAAGGAAAGAGGTAAGSGLLGSVGQFLANNPGLVSAGINAIGSWFGNREAREAAGDVLNLQLQHADAYRRAGLDYAEALRRLLPELQAGYAPRGAAISTEMGSATVDPATGRLITQLAPRYAAVRDQYLGAAQGLFGELRDFNPRTFAQERYAAAQALLRPSDELAQQGLLQDLYRKGGFGLTLNQPGATGGTVGVNPYLDTFLNARNRRDAEMAYRSLSEGEAYLDNLIRRQTGLFGQAVGLDQATAGLLSPAQSWTGELNRLGRTATDASLGLQREGLMAERDATQEYIRAVLGAQTAARSAGAAASQANTNAWTNVIANLPWADIFNYFRG